jgi:Tfp pilus assembly protein PilF
MKMFRIVLLAMCVFSVTPIRASGEEDASRALFGEGIHEYFNGEYELAFDLFTDAIEANGKDPRPHYYRGLTLTRVGRADAAESDFKTGAKLEASLERGAFAVAQSLTRIQGKLRMKLEQYRREARRNARKKRDSAS